MAANGAEPVRWSTVRDFTRAYAPHGFRAEAMCPGYGLAENTLKASGSAEDRLPVLLRLSADALRAGSAAPAEDGDPAPVTLVGSGGTVGATDVRIVDPVSRIQRQDDRVGEIWINGPCVAGGYHGRPEETRQTFQARITGQEQLGSWLRTGDLGFLHQDEVFVTGRLKDVVIRNGRNYYPQDIELSAESADPGLHPNCAAAFSVDDGSTERLVLLVEADGRTLRAGGGTLLERLRAAVRDGQRLDADEILLLRRGSLPKTSSGKVQRGEARRRYLDGEFTTTAATPPGRP